VKQRKEAPIKEKVGGYEMDVGEGRKGGTTCGQKGDGMRRDARATSWLKDRKGEVKLSGGGRKHSRCHCLPRGMRRERRIAHEGAIDRRRGIPRRRPKRQKRNKDLKGSA